MSDQPQDPFENSADSLLTNAISLARTGRFREAGERVLTAMAMDDRIASGPHAYLAQILKKGADLENVKLLGPARLNTLVTSGWLASVITGRPENALGQPIPWFTHPAIDFLEPKIKSNWRVLEWGCGNSTLWWATRVQHVVSIEHNPAWRQIVASQAPTNVIVRLVEDLDRYPRLDEVKELGPFDAIVIDGEQRNLCARTAVAHAKPNGIIIVDNSDRKAVRDGLDFLAQAGWNRIDFFGLLPSYAYRTCTSIFFRNLDFLKSGPLPCDIESSLGPTCAQVLGE